MYRATFVVCCLLLFACTASITGSGKGSPSSSVATTTHAAWATGERPECARNSVDSREYGSHLAEATGHPGDSVEVYGTTLRGEDGRWARSRRLEVWWNTYIPDIRGADAKPVNPDSPVLLLTTVTDMGSCRFHTTFEVPDVPPGRYPIRTIVFQVGEYGWFGYHHFIVK